MRALMILGGVLLVAGVGFTVYQMQEPLPDEKLLNEPLPGLQQPANVGSSPASSPNPANSSAPTLADPGSAAGQGNSNGMGLTPGANPFTLNQGGGNGMDFRLTPIDQNGGGFGTGTDNTNMIPLPMPAQPATGNSNPATGNPANPAATPNKP